MRDDLMGTDGSRNWRRRRYLYLTIGGIVILAGLIGAFQPWTANHFGYALPGAGHLPFRVTSGERDYSNQWQCAGADWCQQHVGPGYCADAASCTRPATLCKTVGDLRQLDQYPLTQVGWIGTLFGAPHSIYTGPHGALTAGIFIEDTPGCFVEYALDGGP